MWYKIARVRSEIFLNATKRQSYHVELHYVLDSECIEPNKWLCSFIHNTCAIVDNIVFKLDWKSREDGTKSQRDDIIPVHLRSIH
jgi:hypothetical protein